MPFPFAAIAGAVIPKLVGGILGRGEEKRARSRGEIDHDRARWEFGKDRRNERAYAARQTADSRAYARKLTAEDRAYAKKLTASDRRYAERQTQKDRTYARATRRNERKYAEGRTADERRYLAKLTAGDRAYAEKISARDRAAYKADQAALQKVANRNAERSAASRSIDFQAMRDDAVAAGFNPLTAMQFANSYSRAVEYDTVGVGGGGMSTPIMPSQAAGSSAFGPSSVIPSTSIGSQFIGSSAGETISAPATSFQMPGTGYAAATGALMSGPAAFEGLLEAGLGAYNQAKADEEAVYESIANQVASSQLSRMMARHNPYQDFGYGLTQQQPFRPAVAVGSPSLRTSSAPPEVWDGVHNRPVQSEPTADIGLTGFYDDAGRKIRGLSQGVEWSELAQMGNEIWIAGNVAMNRVPDWSDTPVLGANWWKNHKTGPRGYRQDYQPSYMGSYAKTGVLPVWNPLR